MYVKKTRLYEKKLMEINLMSNFFIFISVCRLTSDAYKYKLLNCQKTKNNFNNIYRKKFTIYDKYCCQHLKLI